MTILRLSMQMGAQLNTIIPHMITTVQKKNSVHKTGRKTGHDKRNPGKMGENAEKRYFFYLCQI